MPENRRKTGQFKKGVSGNPGGRPKTDERVTKALRAASVDAAQVLIDIMNDPEIPAKIRVTAATAVLDRVYGKPTQHVEAQADTSIHMILDKSLEEYAN